MNNKIRIYVDMDDVLTDFIGEFFEFYHLFPEDFIKVLDESTMQRGMPLNMKKQIMDWAFWKAIKEIPDFWENMQSMPAYKDFWKALEPYNPVILTSVPIHDFVVIDAIEGKRKWINKNLGKHVEMIVTFFNWQFKKTFKELLCKTQYDVLIDNCEDNIDRWVKKGGIGIVYKNSLQALSDFNIVLDLLEIKRKKSVSIKYFIEKFLYKIGLKKPIIKTVHSFNFGEKTHAENFPLKFKGEVA